MARKVNVYDTTGALLRSFNSWKAAYTFCISMGRPDWSIR